MKRCDCGIKIADDEVECFDCFRGKAMNYFRDVRTRTSPNMKEDLLYRMARLMRNTDGVAMTRWGTEAANLLSELRDMDIKKYERLIWK